MPQLEVEFLGGVLNTDDFLIINSNYQKASVNGM